MSWDDMLNAMHAWTIAGSGLDAQKVLWGGQDAARPEAPAIILHISNISELGSTWLDYENNPHTFSAITVTADAGTNVFTAVAHGRLTGDGPVNLDGADLPANTDDETAYWVIKLTDDTFKLATSFQDAVAAVPIAVDLADAGSGVIQLVANDETVRRGEEQRAIARGVARLTVQLRCHASAVVDTNMACAILNRVRTRRELPSQQAILEAANISVQTVERVRVLVTGRRDDFLFEPQAHLDLHVAMPVEESEFVTIIERVRIMNEVLDPDQEFTVP